MTASTPAWARDLGLNLSPDQLMLALTHRSYAYENGGLPTNERLEFLGDSVLGLVVTTALYDQHPDLAEGSLARMRASVVSSKSLARIGRRIGLGDHVLLGRGEENSGGRQRRSILADSLEALIGACYLFEGLDAAADFVHRLVDEQLVGLHDMVEASDWKTTLQEIVAGAGLGAPWYRHTESGPEHEKTFVAIAMVDGKGVGEGVGASKKEAEQIAAREAVAALRARD